MRTTNRTTAGDLAGTLNRLITNSIRRKTAKLSAAVLEAKQSGLQVDDEAITADDGRLVRRLGTPQTRRRQT